MFENGVITHGISMRASISCLSHAVLQKVQDHNQQHKGFEHPGAGDDLHIRKVSASYHPPD